VGELGVDELGVGGVVLVVEDELADPCAGVVVTGALPFEPLGSIGSFALLGREQPANATASNTTASFMECHSEHEREIKRLSAKPPPV
jgi:hypothetical protein